MKNYFYLVLLVLAISACSVDSLDTNEREIVTADLAGQFFTDLEVDGFETTSFDLLHHQTGKRKGAVHVTNDCENLYIQVTGGNEEANLGLYAEESEFPGKNGAGNVAFGNLEYNDEDAVDFLWTFPLSDFEEDGLYIFVNSGAAWGGDQTYGSASFFYYNFQECIVTDVCTNGYGFWKNHTPLENPGNQPNEWPSSVEELYLGNTAYSVEELVTILRAEVRGNGFVSLAHHLITAKLNVANGADDAEIAEIIATADALIDDAQYPTEALSTKEVGEIKDALEAWNEGPTACEGQVEEPVCAEDIWVDLCPDEIEELTVHGIRTYFEAQVQLHSDLPLDGSFSPSWEELLAEYSEMGGTGTVTAAYTVYTEECGEITIEVAINVSEDHCAE